MKAGLFILEALRKVNIPVSRMLIKTNANRPAPDAYITYSLLHSAGSMYADDDVETTESIWRINIFTKNNYIDILNKIKLILKLYGFYGISVDAEQYEKSTGYYHISVEAKYMEMEDLE